MCDIDGILPDFDSEKSEEKRRTISEHDQRVLKLIFNATTKQAELKTVIDVLLPPDQHVKLEKVEELVKLEKLAILREKEGRLKDAVEILDNIIVQEPKYASAYNNRAQMKRLCDADWKSIICDLESAIALSLPEKSTSRVSKMQAQVLRNSYGQLSAVYLQQSKLPENAHRSWQLQMKASDMMVEASKYGEQIALTLAARINPYAQLCGNMMETVLSQYH